MRMSDELRDAEFGDRRLSKRLMTLSDDLAVRPEASFPKAAASDAGLEATYRFLNHEAVTPERILAPHVANTIERASDAGTVLVAHDTTELCFSTDREGLGRLSEGGARGFYAHFALAIAADGSRRPLGVMGLKTIFRRTPPPKKARPRHRTHSEMSRWSELALEVTQRMEGRAQAIHLMDSEADSFALLAKLLGAQCRFVIRLRYDHRIEVSQPGAYRLGEKLELAEQLFYRDVPISARRKAKRKKTRRAHPPRAERTAKLAFSAVTIEMRRPSDWRGDEVPQTLKVNVVHVREVDAPPEDEPIDWRLVTTEPIERLDQVVVVVDHYRTRWLIEEFFKALKTGCAVEKRQLESSRAILNALAIFAPIAWQLLLLRRLAREPELRPATEVLSPLRVQLLQRHKKVRLCAAPTVKDALLAVAQLGGHIKNNGEPGWIVLGRGFDELLTMESGALIALGEM
jgi:Transposase DNA-binding/Transposase DDE domain